MPTTNFIQNDEITNKHIYLFWCWFLLQCWIQHQACISETPILSLPPPAVQPMSSSL